jgi:hypothetical protein
VKWSLEALAAKIEVEEIFGNVVETSKRHIQSRALKKK